MLVAAIRIIKSLLNKQTYVVTLHNVRNVFRTVLKKMADYMDTGNISLCKIILLICMYDRACRNLERP